MTYIVIIVNERGEEQVNSTWESPDDAADQAALVGGKVEHIDDGNDTCLRR